MNRKSIKETTKKEICFRQSYKCCKCEMLLPPSFQIDHIIPWTLSNDDSEENLQALCPNCHSIKTQRESLRILQYKRIVKNCPENYHLCWFCLETYQMKSDEHKCDKVLKNINEVIKTQTKILSSFEEMCNRYKYIEKNKYDNDDTILKITINLFNNTVYVNHVIVKFTEALFIEHITEAVFLATRTKKDSSRYDSVHINIQTKNDDENEEGKIACLSYIENCNIIDELPSRIFKSLEDVVVFYY